MESLLSFISLHPYLVGIFSVLLVLFIRNEMSRGGATISAQELVQLVNNEGAVVLDVRDKAEFEQGHIVDSINIPYANVEARVDELKKYKEQPLVIACKMGQHSGAAGTALRKHGFEKVSRLRGGITEWRGQNLPVVKA
ncbi:MAG: rhodanese-like domain-containing protein [Gammaproteobacteria bacterium]|nr:rhodanese-like domain-containing protein [Gammaproteobacteria bacterium]